MTDVNLFIKRERPKTMLHATNIVVVTTGPGVNLVLIASTSAHVNYRLREMQKCESCMYSTDITQ